MNSGVPKGLTVPAPLVTPVMLNDNYTGDFFLGLNYKCDDLIIEQSNIVECPVQKNAISVQVGKSMKLNRRVYEILLTDIGKKN